MHMYKSTAKQSIIYQQKQFFSSNLAKSFKPKYTEKFYLF